MFLEKNKSLMNQLKDFNRTRCQCQLDIQLERFVTYCEIAAPQRNESFHELLKLKI